MCRKLYLAAHENGPAYLFWLYGLGPRDLSHYETFEHYHATFYKHVEALSVTPFSSGAIARGLSALLVSEIRLRGSGFKANAAAGRIGADEPYIEDAIERIARRGHVVACAEVAEPLRAELREQVDEWRASAGSVSGGSDCLPPPPSTGRLAATPLSTSLNCYVKIVWVPDETMVRERAMRDWARHCLVALAAKGASLDELRDFCNETGRRKDHWGMSTWHALLQPSVLLQHCGYGVWNVRTKQGRERPPSEWIIVENAHEALISELEARQIAAVRGGRRTPVQCEPFSEQKLAVSPERGSGRWRKPPRAHTGVADMDSGGATASRRAGGADQLSAPRNRYEWLGCGGRI